MRVGVEPQVHEHPVQFQQKIPGAIRHGGPQGQLRDGVAGQLHGDKHGGHGIGEDQHAVLRHLRVGNAFHTAEHGVDKHDPHSDGQTHVDVHFEETGKHDADPAHLSGHVGKRDEDETQRGHEAGQVRVIPFADKFRHGEFAELA